MASLEDEFVQARPQADRVGSAKARAALLERLAGVNAALPRVGRFVLGERVGAGAMGVVYAAHDPRLERKVAVKILRPESRDPDHERRLVEEAKTLARLSHPNVVSVFDVGAVEGDVYLAMEFVDGQTLERWSRDSRPWAEVHEALCQAGRGLAAAHDCGLVHRDFKPHNVMVDREGGRVRVMDFGLARPVSIFTVGDASDTVADSSRATSLGVVGTPAYMAPEQHAGEAADARTDQYSFCVTAWQALSGAHPFRGQTYAELTRAKLEGRPPWRRPSTLPRFIVNALRRGLDPDPGRRWPSMRALLFVFSGAAARRRRRVIGGGVVVAGLTAAATAGVVYASSPAVCGGSEHVLVGVWDPHIRTEVRAALSSVDVPYAATTADSVGRGLDRYRGRWIQTHRDVCEATSVRGEQPPEVMDRRMACLSRAKAELSAVVEILRHPDARIVKGGVSLAEGVPAPERCAQAQPLEDGPLPPSPTQAEGVGRVRARLATVRALLRAGDHAGATVVLEEIAGDVQTIDYAPLTAEVRYARGRVQEQAGAFDVAQRDMEEAFQLALRNGHWRLAFSVASRLVFVVGRQRARPTEGLVFAAIARGLAGRSGVGPLQVAELRARIGSVLYAQGRYEEAAAEQRAQLDASDSAGGQSRDLTVTRGDLAMTLHALGRSAEAEAMVREALRSLEGILGTEHPEVGGLRNNLVAILLAQGKLEEAQTELEHVLELLGRTLGPEHPNVAGVRSNLALVRFNLKDYERAKEDQVLAVASLQASLGAEHPNTLSARLNLANTLAVLGDTEGAEAQQRIVLMMRKKVLGPDHPATAFSHNDLGATLRESGRGAAAEPHLREAIRIHESLGPKNPDLVTARLNLALALLDLGQLVAAEEQGRLALQLAEEVFSPDHHERIKAARALNSVRRARGAAL